MRLFRSRLTFLKTAPGPSPWFLRDQQNAPLGFTWCSAGNDAASSGKTLLVGQFGPVAILGFYNYVMLLDEETFVVWHQQYVESGKTAPVLMTVLRPSALPPLLGKLESVYKLMDEQKISLHYGGEALSVASIATSEALELCDVLFPPEVRHIPELLVLCHSSVAEATPSWESGDLALMVASPPDSTVRLYAQDWFNKGGMDFGYQWVTRVARDPKTRRVHGEGVRISPFILDSSLRQLEGEMMTCSSPKRM